MLCMSLITFVSLGRTIEMFNVSAGRGPWVRFLKQKKHLNGCVCVGGGDCATAERGLLRAGSVGVREHHLQDVAHS